MVIVSSGYAQISGWQQHLHVYVAALRRGGSRVPMSSRRHAFTAPVDLSSANTMSSSGASTWNDGGLLAHRLRAALA